MANEFGSSSGDFGDIIYNKSSPFGTSDAAAR